MEEVSPYAYTFYNSPLYVSLKINSNESAIMPQSGTG